MGDMVGPLFVPAHPDHKEPDPFSMIKSMSKLRFVEEIRYRSTQEIASAAEGMPAFDEALDAGRYMATMLPDDIRTAMKDLSTYADGVDSFELTGFPNNYKISAKFTNFHLTPVLKSIIDEAEAGEDAEIEE